ncbi:MAG: OsmC family protein [Fidelibacterota bacterium]
MSEDGSFSLTLKQVHNYEFETTFDWGQVPPILLDEPEPLGRGKGPNASRLLGAAVGNCLSASLLFCLQKARVDVKTLQTKVLGVHRRSDRGRLRIGKIGVHIIIDVETDSPPRLKRCLEIFEDYCVVTASVRKGIEVGVRVTDLQGNLLFQADGIPPEEPPP